MSTTIPDPLRTGTETVGAFRHEALFYSGHADFVAKTSAFIVDGLAGDEPILVAVSQEKINLLRAELGVDAARVTFIDMVVVGHNPARIIPTWRDFVAERTAGNRFARGIGEPIWAERTPDELVECQRHESLLNLAFDGTPAWWLVCPYDAESLPRDVLDEAARSHPYVQPGGRTSSARYVGLDQISRPFDVPLPDLGTASGEMWFGPGSLDSVRRFVAEHAFEAGLSASRAADFVLAANELATNSLRHGGGTGTLRVWRRNDAVVLEVEDRGRITQPLAGRERPKPGQEGGLGLWLVNHICDLVQVRSFATGTVVRVHMAAR